MQAVGVGNWAGATNDKRTLVLLGGRPWDQMACLSDPAVDHRSYVRHCVLELLATEHLRYRIHHLGGFFDNAVQ